MLLNNTSLSATKAASNLARMGSNPNTPLASSNAVWTTTVDPTGNPSVDPGPIRGDKIKTNFDENLGTARNRSTLGYISGVVYNRNTRLVGGSKSMMGGSGQERDQQQQNGSSAGAVGVSSAIKHPHNTSDYVSQSDTAATDTDRELHSASVPRQIISHSQIPSTNTLTSTSFVLNPILSGSINQNPGLLNPNRKISSVGTQTTEDEDTETHRIQKFVKKFRHKSSTVEYILRSCGDWAFPIFSLGAETSNPLTALAYRIFESSNLFDLFKLPKRKFLHFFYALESGYRDLPYHNRVHAADVVQGVWYLSTQGIHDFEPPIKVSNVACSNSLAAVIPALELMALYLAAAMHDYDHPGKSNAFLVATSDPLAILYNDRSVLEQHHAASSWLLFMDNDKNFISHLPQAEKLRLRFLILECILATDLSKHFDLLATFRNLNEQTSDGKIKINWGNDANRLLVSQILIKMVDIGNCGKPREIHLNWAENICTEFFIQGDEERAKNLPISQFMDREKPEISRLQREFMRNLVLPTAMTLMDAKLLPGNSLECPLRYF